MARIRSKKSTVAIGLVGQNLDAGAGPRRWDRWRPSVDLCRQPDLVIERFELLYEVGATHVARQVEADIQQVSPETTVVLRPVKLKDPWDFEEVYATLLDFVRATKFSPDNEDYLVHITTGTHVAQICWFLLVESRELPARLVQTAPAGGKTRTPDLGVVRIIDLDLSKYDQIASRFRQDQREGLSFLKAGIDTKNRRYNDLVAEIEQVAIKSRSPLLLSGPTGSGKTRLARRIFELKQKRKQVSGRLMEVNCATLRGDQAMSMLFGHAKGAFTGAIQDRTGVLSSAHAGVLFLDEIGELGLDEQAMLLHAIEDKRFLPVGSDREVESDFQLIAGTNRDLGELVKAGRFREDLLARIDTWTFVLPGLKDRPDDIAPNLEFELARFSAREQTRVTFSKEALGAFLKFATGPAASWNANFRDLSSAVERMATLATGGRITPDVVHGETERLARAWRRGDPVDSDRHIIVAALGEAGFDDLDLFDRVQLAAVLRVCREAKSLSEAGRKLFAASLRQRGSVNDADRLRKYLARFDLRFQDIQAMKGAKP